VGKLHLSTAADGQEPRVNDGYRYFQYSHSHKGPRQYGHDYAEWLRLQGEDVDALMSEPTDINTYLQGAKQARFGGIKVPTEEQDNFPPHLHQTHWCSEKAIEFIDKNRYEDQPWLLSMNPFDPHAPFDPPHYPSTKSRRVQSYFSAHEYYLENRTLAIAQQRLMKNPQWTCASRLHIFPKKCRAKGKISSNFSRSEGKGIVNVLSR